MINDRRADDDLPNPAAASTSAGLVDALCALRLWAGQPSLRRLRGLAGVTRDLAGRETDLLPEATTSYILRGVRPPSASFVRAFVTACLRARHRDSGWIQGEVERWHRAWLTVNRTHRRVGMAAGPDAGRRVPGQLPPSIADFTGRQQQLAALDRLLPADRGEPNGASVTTIEGTPGVGKTALALAWAHRARPWFPDGQMYLDLQGYALPEPLTPVEALTRLLHGLGVPSGKVPANVALAASQYRSLLADTRTLLILDNAASADQVRPLLPGSPNCLTLVTSRDRLGGLTARDGARRLVLGPLSAADSCELITTLLDPETVAQEPAAVATLGVLCDHLPLALRVAAANIAGMPSVGRVGRYVAVLRDSSRLSALEIPGDSHASVVAAFDLSYARLPEGARVMLRRLGLFPGHRVTEAGAAALAGMTLARAQDALAHLVSRNLLTTPEPDQYLGHDLLRRYAAGRLRQEESSQDRRAALRRIHHYYLRHIGRSAELLYPNLLRLSASSRIENGDTLLADRAAARRWLAAESPNLLAVTRSAFDAGELSTTYFLSDALRGYAVRDLHTSDSLSLGRLGLAAARTAGDAAAQASARYSLGWIRCSQGRFRLAARHSAAAARSAREAGWVEGVAAATGLCGTIHAGRGQLHQAMRCFREATVHAEHAGWAAGQYSELANLAQVLLWMGNLPDAATSIRRALVVAERARLPSDPSPLRTLAEVEHARGNLAEARGRFEESASVARKLGSRGCEGYAHRGLAELSRDAGDLTRAAELVRVVAGIATATGDQRLATYARITGASIAPPDEYERAVEDCRCALEYAASTGRPLIQAEALVREAQLRHLQRRPHLAHDRVQHGLTIARDGGFRLWEGRALTVQAQIYLGEGSIARSLELSSAALSTHGVAGHRLGEAEAVLTLARALGRSGDEDRARERERSARALLREIGAAMPPSLAAYPAMAS